MISMQLPPQSKPFMVALYPEITYLDPSETLAQHIKTKYGHCFPEKEHKEPNLLVLATENPTTHLFNTDFERNLLKLGCSDPVHSISISEQAH